MTIEAAASSATEIFRDPDQPTPYEPQSLDEGKAAVEAFASAYERADKTLRRAAERSRSGASSLSDDPLQGLSEVIQNADDQGASYVRIVYTTSSITFFHDGDAAHLKNIHAISLPWLTTNEENSETTGRFGIGLSTLQTLSDHFDFFSGTYRVRVGSPFLTWLDGDPPASADPSDVTVLRVPLDKSEIDAAQFMRWVEVWDHQGLIFLKSVRSVIFQGESLDTTLRLESHLANSGSGGDAVRVRRVEDPDGRSWRVFSQDFDTPPGLTRKAKKTASTATIDIAFPMADVPSTGQLYAGLAVESFPIPVLINAPFDPTTSRRGFLSNEWNGAISSLVLETWESAVVDLFLTDPEHAWAHVPVKAGSGLGLSQSANQLASNLYERATRLAERVQLRIDEVNVELSQTAAEVPALNGVMDSAAMERLLGVTWVPSDQRDDSGIWLSVWNHWLAEGQPIHPLVEPSDAAPLLESPDRSDEWVIRLHSIVIEDDSDDLAVGKPCIVTSSGRFPMPDQDAIVAFSREESTGLGRSLGVTTTLSEIYETAPGGSVVLGHLTDQKRLLDEHSPEALLLHLARIGGSGDVEPIPVTDDQLIEIRIAVETLGRMFFNEIGEGLGKAIAVDCVHSVGETRETKRVRPADAYLGRPYMTEARSWAAAATTRVGWWVHPRYDSMLQSDLPPDRQIGARRFFSGLGASVYGRIEPVSKFDKVYAGDRRGGTALNGRPRARRSAVSALGADHTLDDSTSPDLFRAARDIAGEANPTARRRRAIALLDSIRAGWRNQYARESRVQAASAYFAWGVRGDVRALWLWELGRVRWIDNADGEPMAPQELKLRTPSNLTFHGDDPSALIHPDFEGSDAQTLREVGVAGEPNPPELLDALSTIRDSDTPDATKFSQSLGIYAALGDWIVSSDAAPGERRQVTEEFLNEPLIFTGVEWFTSKNAFRGEPIFREYRNFAPPGSDQIEALWRSINLPTPDVLDCANVLIEIADSGPLTEEVVPVVVEILRYAERSDIPAPTPHTVKKWKTLPVWTGSNWSVKRPIYAVGNTLLAEAVAGKVATWKPQVDIEQFSGVPEMLGLTQLSENAVTVTADGDFDPDATDAFSEVVSALHSDLALNNAELFRSLSLPWDDLAKVSVHVSTQIVATITLEQRTFEAPISAWLDRTNLQLHVGKEHSVLESADVAIAVAALFKSAARTAEDSWFRASRTIEKTSGPSKRQVTTSLEIDSKQRQTNVEKAKQALGGLLDSVGNPPKIRGNRKRAGARELDVGTQPDPETKPAKRRVLIDPDEWAFTSTDGKFIEGKAPPRAKPKKPQTKHPLPPTTGSNGKPPSATHRSYTEEQRESIGLELVRRIIGSEDNRVHDLRKQAGVGADAVDDLERFFELKVSGGGEPDKITLEPSQVARALTDPNFFLVIVSGVEQDAADVSVRFIHSPVELLAPTEKTKLEFSGIRTATSVVFSAKKVSETESSEDPDDSEGVE